MPVEPWDLKSDDSRKEDRLVTFIIFCEDENDEPYYFRSFEIENKLKVNAISNQKHSKLNLSNAIKKCNDDSLMEIINGALKLKQGINVWCVYDRDMEVPIKAVEDLNFTTAIQTAANVGMKVAWSNDAFELWALLHFEVIVTGRRLHRDFIYERLTAIFSNINNPSQELAAIIANPNFYYKSQMKRRVNFVLHVLPLLKGNTTTAINNATALETVYSQNIPFHDRNPCTMVHHLVQELLAFRNP